MRLVLWIGLVLAGCAMPAEAPPAPVLSAARLNDPALLATFFGDGGQRAVSPVIRCAVRCGPVRSPRD